MIINQENHLLPDEGFPKRSSTLNRLSRIWSLSTYNLFDKAAAAGAGGATCFSICT
jgi:hypothetical protein